jgi:hypothetical protein
MCVSLFMRIGYTKDLERYPLASISIRLESCAQQVQRMLYQHALWMARYRAQQQARQVWWTMYHRAQQMEYQRIRQEAYLCHQQLMLLRAQQHEGEDAQYWALRRRVMQRLGTRQAHWNPHLMHKFPIFCKYNPCPVNHYKTCMFC